MITLISNRYNCHLIHNKHVLNNNLLPINIIYPAIYCTIALRNILQKQREHMY
jgi:hypothetical protein